MRSRLLLLRRTRPAKLLRTFAQTTAVRSDLRGRPQLPFLSVPTTRFGRVRYLTTERRAQLKYEIKTGIKYVGYIWIAGFTFAAAWFAYVEESLERKYPTPHEWSFLTRIDLRGGNCARYETAPGKITNWLQVAGWFEKTVARLEDPAIDGKDVRDAPHECPPGTKDVTAKSENWRRGYYEALMGYAKAAEYMDGWVLDKTRDIVFPAGTMIGPSNPFPKPLPAGFRGAPREEDCELRFDPPDAIYLRILCTPGFTNRQKIEAGLAYASWLEYKGIAGPASIVLEDAVHLAASERPHLPAPPLDAQTWTLNEAAGLPSENLLTTLTAYATFRARQGAVTSALPILISLLKARRSLPTTQSTPQNTTPQTQDKSLLTKLFIPPPYPPEPPSGTLPPIRDPLALCNEAALSLHIGEILYTTGGPRRAEEEGLAWTREAVDTAEEQLHHLPAPQARDAYRESAARKVCRECLATGLGNWGVMVKRLAREEEARAKTKVKGEKEGGGGWFGGWWLWGAGATAAAPSDKGDGEATNRWKVEEKVIEDRERRVRDLLEDLKPPPRGVLSWLKA